MITGKPGHRLLRNTLYADYQTYCQSRNVIPASLINIGMLLGQLGVKKKVRVGGYKGKGQQYAYVGICSVTSPEEEDPRTRSRIYKKRKPQPTRVFSISKKTASLHKFFKKYYVTPCGSTSSVTVKEFSLHYRRYCKSTNQPPVSSVTLMVYMQERGVKTSLRMGKGTQLYYYGLIRRNLAPPPYSLPTQPCPVPVYTLPVPMQPMSDPGR